MKRTSILLTLLVFICTTSSLLAQYNVYNIVQVLKHPKPDLISICAHRGYWQESGVPENSLKSIERAVHFGIEMVELDIKMSKDRVPVLMHDYHLRRTTTYDGDQGVFDWNNGDLQRLHLVDKFGQTSAETVPTLEQALDYVNNHKLSVVLTLDIKTIADAQACWNIVKRKTNAWGSPAYDWVIFKLGADLFPSGPAVLENAFRLNDSHFVPGAGGGLVQYKYNFKLMMVYTTSMADKFNCFRLYSDTKVKPYFVAVEVNLKENFGIHSDIVDQSRKKDHNGLGCFNPVADAGTSGSYCGMKGTVFCGSGPNQCYWMDGGWCKYQLRDVQYHSADGKWNDHDDRRWDWNWLPTWNVTFLTTDDPIQMNNFYNGWGKRNKSWYINRWARMGSEEIASSGTLSAYPNPTAGMLTVSLTQDNTGPVQFDVVDMTGKPVFTQQQNVEEGQQEIVLNDLKSNGLKPGVYFLQVTPADVRRRKTVKIVVE